MQLVETPDNPIPRRPNVMAVETEDGVTLRAARWRPTTRRDRGTVCILQGRAELIEMYFETVTELRRRVAPPPPCFAWSPSLAARGRINTMNPNRP